MNRARVWTSPKISGFCTSRRNSFLNPWPSATPWVLMLRCHVILDICRSISIGLKFRFRARATISFWPSGMETHRGSAITTQIGFYGKSCSRSFRPPPRFPYYTARLRYRMPGLSSIIYTLHASLLSQIPRRRTPGASALRAQDFPARKILRYRAPGVYAIDSFPQILRFRTPGAYAIERKAYFSQNPALSNARCRCNRALGFLPV